MKPNTIHLGDCLDLMTDIPNHSIDMILADLPYGTTACAWDSIIPLKPLWKHYKRIIKPRGAIVLTGSQPFTSKLVMSNLGWFKYEWVWEKSRPSGYVQAKNKPMKIHENILIFSPGTTVHKDQSNNRMTYNPQDVIFNPKRSFRPGRSKKSNASFGSRPSSKDEWIQEYENYPDSVLKVQNPNTKSLHPTQKPLKLLEYLLKTYSNQGDLILDNCFGSGSTLVACQNTNRSFIGIEKEKEYFDAAAKWLKDNRILLDSMMIKPWQSDFEKSQDTSLTQIPMPL